MEELEHMSELEKRLKDVDVSELPDSFRLFGDYSGVDDEEELDDDDEEEIDDEPNEEDDSDFVDEDEEQEKDTKKYIKYQIRSALEPLKEVIEWHDGYGKYTLVHEEEFEEYLKEIRKAYRELLKLLRHI